ncbi:MFS transporter [Roseomonas marmotae]|uniref:MFS transporter n=1 Tax=Roseomonas marmotae TaxID=2768161 RepID=A0ABS3KD41_9PROT|nr:MFS transporter [Roseomonas marmotae]MBO1074912.1 MFS transporter [Roseomonas marmotae]QTI80040.1 MFS transporter [Roseomonas marmotae]
MPSARSQRGLDWLTFFAADVQTGFGPFIAVYLTAHHWSAAQVGLALSVGTLTAMVAQVPAGMLVDATRHKRMAALLALIAIAGSALLLALWPSTIPVMASEVLHGIASAVLVPALAAISLSMVGRAELSTRLGRNGRYASLGNAAAAAGLGLAGAYISAASVFWLTALLTIPAILALRSIRSQDLQAKVRSIRSRRRRKRKLRDLLLDRGVLIFAACCALFTLSNAAMLPLAGAEATHASGGKANLIVGAGLVVSQIVVAAISPRIGEVAETRGRRVLLLAGLSVLPIRGALLAFWGGPWALMAAQALDGLTAGVFAVLVPLVAADLTRGTNRFNLCMGLFGLAVGIGGSISTTAAGAVASWAGPSIAFIGLGGVGVLTFLLVLFAMPETRQSPRPEPQPQPDQAPALTG